MFTKPIPLPSNTLARCSVTDVKVQHGQSVVASIVSSESGCSGFTLPEALQKDEESAPASLCERVMMRAAV